MRVQTQIQRTLGVPEAVVRVAAILALERFPSRMALGRRICEEFGFQDARGRWQLAGCLKALRVMAGRSQRISLPAPAGTVLVALLRECRDRKHDRPPGHQTIWKGQSKLTTATVGHLVCSKWRGGRGSED